MNKKVELILNNTQYLDLTDDIIIPLTYQIDDIRDPSKKNTSFSKTINIPGTKNNNNIFGGLFDVNADYTVFNPNIRTEAKLIVDSTTIIDGVLQLTNIKKDNTTDLQSNRIIYEVVLFDQTVDFMKNIGDKELSELDLSVLDHTRLYTTYNTSWSHTWENGYVYPLMLNNNNNLEYGYNHFQPSIFHKYYVQKIINDAGYTVGGKFWDENEFYDKEIIPYNGKTPTINKTELERRKYKVGYSSVPTSLLIHIHNEFGYERGLGNGINNVPTSPSRTNLTQLTPNDNSSGGNFDNANHWRLPTDPAPNNTWLVDADGLYNLNVNYNVDVIMTTAVDAWYSENSDNTASFPTETPEVVVSIRAIVNPAAPGSTLYVGSSVLSNRFNLPKNPDSSTPAFRAANSRTVTESVLVKGTLFQNKELLTGDQVTLQIAVHTINSTTSYQYVTSKTGGSLTNLTYTVQTNNNGETFIANDPKKALLNKNAIINVNNFIPLKIKQKDLINDLIKRYNLYISTDPNDRKKLIFETRDEFYDRGITIDWTDKKDYNSEDTIQLLTEITDKELDFTYKSDKDPFNTNYTDATSDVYGIKKIVFSTDFKSSKKEIKTPFSPTPSVYGNNFRDTIVPGIDAEAPNNNVRVLYYGGLKDVLNNQTWKFLDNGTTITHTTYPFVSHFDDYFNATIDLNYGSNIFYYYTDLATVTDNNLYNRYWRNYVEQIAEGKMIISKFKLNEVDISQIKDDLNTKIFVKDSYYYINKIKDFNPNNQLTTVELIKVKPFTTFVSSQVTIDEIDIPRINNFVVSTKKNFGDAYTENTSGFGSLGLIGGGSVNGSIQAGSYETNQLLNEFSIVSGKNNLVSETSENIMIAGDNNFIDSESSNVMITGNNNSVDSGVTNSAFIGVSGQNLTASNEVWITENFKVTETQVVTNLTFASTSGIGLYPLLYSENSTSGVIDYTSITTDFGNNFIYDSIYTGIFSGSSNVITNSSNESVIISGFNNFIYNAGQSSIISGYNHIIIDSSHSIIGGGDGNYLGNSANYSSIIGGLNNTSGYSNSHIIGSGITADTSDTTFVNKLNIVDNVGDTLKFGSAKFREQHVGNFKTVILKENPVVNSLSVLHFNINSTSGSIETMGVLNYNLQVGFYENGTAGIPAGFGGGSSDPVFLSSTLGSKFTSSSIRGSVIIGGTSPITATKSNTVYVPELEAQSVIRFAEYTVAGVPTASSHQGGMIMVTNETGGYVPAFSDGTNWRRVTDRAVIS